MAFNAKNLSYDSNEPSFLRKLKSQYGGESARHERPSARPRKQKNDDDDDDDGPTYVDESNNDTVTKEEYEKMLNPESTGEKSLPVESAEASQSIADVPSNLAPKKTAEAAIGRNNKRRLAKVVGADEEVPLGDTGGAPKKTKKPVKKSKKIKLSFDEEA